MPWVLLPILPMLAWRSPTFAGVSLSLPYLFIPVAAALGRRYGFNGMIVVGISGVALLIAFSGGFGSFGGDVAIYLIALGVCWAAGSSDRLRDLRSRVIAIRPAAFVAVLVLLPLSVSVYDVTLDNGLAVRLSFRLWPLFYFALFALGLVGFSGQRVLIGVVAATVAGALVRIFALDTAATELSASALAHLGFGDSLATGFRLSYGLSDAQTLLTSLAYFSAGRHLFLRSQPHASSGDPWRRPYLAILFVMLLWSGVYNSWTREIDLVPGAEYWFVLYGEYAALPLAAFMAGFLLAYRGMLLSLGLTIAFLALNNSAVLMYFLGWEPPDYPSLSLEIDSLLICVTYCLLGLRLRECVEDRRSEFPGKRWFQYLGIAACTVLLILPPSGQHDLVMDAILFCLAATAGILLVRVRRWLHTRSVNIAPDGWVRFAALLGVVAAFAMHFAVVYAAIGALLIGLRSLWGDAG